MHQSPGSILVVPLLIPVSSSLVLHSRHIFLEKQGNFSVEDLAVYLSLGILCCAAFSCLSVLTLSAVQHSVSLKLNNAS